MMNKDDAILRMLSEIHLERKEVKEQVEQRQTKYIRPTTSSEEQSRTKETKNKNQS